MTKRWTDSEVRFLKDNVGKMSVQGLADAEEIYITEDVYAADGVQALLTGLNVTRKSAPAPNRLSTLHVPPWSAMMRWQRESPKPVPTPGGFVVKKGSKRRVWISGGMPGPVSATCRMTRWF